MNGRSVARVAGWLLVAGVVFVVAAGSLDYRRALSGRPPLVARSLAWHDHAPEVWTGPGYRIDLELEARGADGRSVVHAKLSLFGVTVVRDWIRR